jgi:hypothetical protein
MRCRRALCAATIMTFELRRFGQPVSLTMASGNRLMCRLGPGLARAPQACAAGSITVKPEALGLSDRRCAA